MNVNYDIYDPQSPVDLMLAQLIVSKQIFATGNEYAAACRFCAVQLEVTQNGVKVQFPPVAKDEDIAVWLRELKERDQIKQAGNAITPNAEEWLIRRLREPNPDFSQARKNHKNDLLKR